MNGLTFLQAGLSLCYFNRLPHSIIKQIFNVGFLEKLDAELAACYSKVSCLSISARKTVIAAFARKRQQNEEQGQFFFNNQLSKYDYFSRLLVT